MKLELIPVQIPPETNWDHKRDSKYTENLLGDDWSFEDVLLRCFNSQRELSEALRRALVFFGEDLEHQANLTIPELIERVEKRIRSMAPSSSYLERFTEALSVCRFVQEEWSRVIGIYGGNQSLDWLAPLADLGDWLVTATMNFEEGMVCEHSDFKREWTRYFSRRGKSDSLVGTAVNFPPT